MLAVFGELERVLTCSVPAVGQSQRGVLQHVESRESRRPDASHQVVLRLTLAAADLRHLLRSLRQSGALAGLDIIGYGAVGAAKGRQPQGW